MTLQGKTIILGVTGGIAAYKSAFLIRLLRQTGAKVYVVLTEEGEKFIGKATFQALSGHPVWLSNDHYPAAGGMGHIDLARSADMILVAPCTANTLAKIAHGFADNLLTELILAREIPLVLAPAMNQAMWASPATQNNVALLKSQGVIIYGPEVGIQACGEEGSGRLLEPVILVELLQALGAPAILKGKKVLITLGGTEEALDPVRSLRNCSSGRMGVALARACRDAGAKVTVVYGLISVDLPYGVDAIKAESAEAMYNAVHAHLQDKDIFISVAAVADYRPKKIEREKIKRHEKGELLLELVPKPDILASVAKLKNAPFCVGFAAESKNIVEYGQSKRHRKGVPLLIANNVRENMDTEKGSVYIISSKGIEETHCQDKYVIAERIVEVIADLMN